MTALAASPPLPAPVTASMVDAAGLAMHVIQAGSGAPIVLLHGFPDHAAAWRPLIDQLSADHRVIAPDLRGYNLTERPLAIDAYRPAALIGDIIGLLDALDLRQAILCGHDWGGVLAAWVAMTHPDRVAGLVLINAPPPNLLQTMIWDDPGQRAASQYIAFLQSAAADAPMQEAHVEALLTRFLGRDIAAGQLTPADVESYRTAWTRPGVWQAMLAWYRASPFHCPPADETAPSRRWTTTLPARIERPVQLIWGARDRVFVPAMPERIAAMCHDASVAILPDAGHVPHRADPARCAGIIRAFRARLPA
ncbi:alpha/beta fold hydrolase [Sandaracinobacteroides saxicola]|uniref:Alpha/beta hydrolase n=1 Tax=Sandaracinobacteroides saxicola TaxID=2759707 RepID=A0A7G5ILH9_9SPHN|nr:alpha/beta hydrolase [Sandaracinobacteroides saxicola]QMW24221.1 alpha/beta hydrolase [Sandaracinobacteroides saxicola]